MRLTLWLLWGLFCFAQSKNVALSSMGTIPNIYDYESIHSQYDSGSSNEYIYANSYEYEYEYNYSYSGESGESGESSEYDYEYEYSYSRENSSPFIVGDNVNYDSWESSQDFPIEESSSTGESSPSMGDNVTYDSWESSEFSPSIGENSPSSEKYVAVPVPSDESIEVVFVPAIPNEHIRGSQEEKVNSCCTVMGFSVSHIWSTSLSSCGPISEELSVVVPKNSNKFFSDCHSFQLCSYSQNVCFAESYSIPVNVE
jgi:hypothetical protein